MRPRLFQLEQHRFQDIFPGIFYFHPATSRSRRHQVGSGLDPVRQHVVVASVQALHTIDFNGRGTVAFDIGTHGDQALGQIHHFRLAGRVFEDGFTLGERSCHHQVFGTRYGDRIQENVGTLQPAIGLGLDVAILHLYVGTHHFQTVDVQVNRSGTDGTATRQGDFGFAKMCHQRAKHQYGGAHGLYQLVRCMEVLDGVGVHFNTHLFVNEQLHPHATEQLDHGGNIVQVRQVADGNRLIRQQCRRQNGQGRVLGTGNANFAIQGLSTPDQ